MKPLATGDWPRAAGGGMSEIRSFEDLQAWKLSVSLTTRVYRATAAFPSDERFGLVSQMRRSAVAVPSNIAEGWGRGQTRDYARFIRVARGSAYELQTQLLISSELGFVAAVDFEDLMSDVQQVGRVVSGLLRSIEAKLTER
ncbi:MAG: four helix bundle protein [Planctomycetota bacterium]